MSGFPYHRPRTLQEAWRLKAECADACFLAGGTDVMVNVNREGVRPAAIISLRAIPGLSGIEAGPTTRIGALTTIAEVLAHGELGKLHPILSQAARTLGSPQIRNAATIGGNICNASPCADMAPPLLVSEARVVLEGPRGSREMPLEEFFVGRKETRLAGEELLSAILLPPPEPGARCVFMKKSRVMMDLSLASLAMMLWMEGATCVRARIAAGSVAPTPVRLRVVEELLEGARITPEVVQRARELGMRSVTPITDVRTRESYRRRIVGVFLERATKGLLSW